MRRLSTNSLTEATYLKEFLSGILDNRRHELNKADGKIHGDIHLAVTYAERLCKQMAEQETGR